MHLVVVQDAGMVQLVGFGVKELAGNGDPGPVGQVPAMGQGHAQNGVAGFEEGQINRQIRR